MLAVDTGQMGVKRQIRTRTSRLGNGGMPLYQVEVCVCVPVPVCCVPLCVWCVCHWCVCVCVCVWCVCATSSGFPSDALFHCYYHSCSWTCVSVCVSFIEWEIHGSLPATFCGTNTTHTHTLLQYVRAHTNTHSNIHYNRLIYISI